MKGIKEAFIDAGEISRMLGIGMTKAYAIIKEYNAELEAKGYFTMRGKCPRKYFEQKIYGYEDYYNPLRTGATAFNAGLNKGACR